ncbi:MAG: hypothetical protein RLO51_11050 [Thalassobaculum sp.]|uniref:hypothetical protein n=1 Tax=Thalassobaculum sp. TaxID=2022740 RepID=UPI0032EBD1AE
MANQPAAKFRIGYLTATIWANDGNNKTFYSVDLSRTYKDGDEYKETSSLGHADIMNAVRVLQRAEQWIAEQA